VNESPALYVVPDAATAEPKPVQSPAATPAPRETSWRDLVRRLSKNPPKQR
jgi:hypothetical protein